MKPPVPPGQQIELESLNRKRPYEAPKLEVHGQLQTITGSTGVIEIP